MKELSPVDLMDRDVVLEGSDETIKGGFKPKEGGYLDVAVGRFDVRQQNNAIFATVPSELHKISNCLVSVQQDVTTKVASLVGVAKEVHISLAYNQHVHFKFHQDEPEKFVWSAVVHLSPRESSINIAGASDMLFSPRQATHMCFLLICGTVPA